MKTRILLTTSILAASLLATVPASAGGFFGFSTYGGSTTVVAGNGEGSRTVISVGLGGFHSDVRERPVPGSIQVDDGHGGWKNWERPSRSNEMGSSTFEGRTTTRTNNNDGSHTVTVTEHGKTSSDVHVTPRPGSIQVDNGKGGWTDYHPQPKSRDTASSTEGGRTTTSTKNDDGSHTVTVTENGETKSEILVVPRPGSIQVDNGKGGWKEYKPQPKSKLIASSTYDGKTVTVTDNGDGTHTVTTIDENGNTTTEIHAKGR